MTGWHVDLRDGIQQTVSGVIDPYIDALEVMQSQSQHAVDVFGVADVARKAAVRSGRPIRARAASARRRIAREQHDTRSLLREKLGNGLADAHRSTGDHDYFPDKFHARVVFSAAWQVKMSRYGPQLLAYNRLLLGIVAAETVPDSSRSRVRGQMASRQPVRCRRSQCRTGDFVALLPLFPLDVVLLPGTPLPLHIFEPRYKEMIGECLANKTPFGVVRALDEGLAEVGCTAEIVTVTKEYADGRMDLIAEGRKRFEVVELNQDRSFLQARSVAGAG